MLKPKAPQSWLGRGLGVLHSLEEMKEFGVFLEVFSCVSVLGFCYWFVWLDVR